MVTSDTSFLPTAIAQSHQSHAVVIGGSISGLVAARVLSKHFDQVTIIERDHFPDKPQPRQGVPQSFHPHVLLVQGQRILEQFFPKLKEELINQGALSIDWAADFRWLLKKGWTPRFSSEIVSCACTRNLLETIIRQQLLEDGKVTILEGTSVTNLLTNSSQTQVIGLRIRNHQKQAIDFLAQLVVDASGRNSQAPKWLKSLGYEVPQETTVKSFLGYATRWYQSLSRNVDYKTLYLMPNAPTHSRGAVMHQVEGGQWLVNLIGVGQDYPPTDEIGFLDFARSMRSPEVYEAIKDAQPITSIYGYQRTENRWRHYERLSRFPENFVLLGDAVCAFNPVYGQGITIAAKGALMLDRCLEQYHHRSLLGLSQHFQKKLAKVNIIPWLMATSDDLRWPTTEGAYPNFSTRLMQWYLEQVMLVATESAEVYRVLIEVLHFLKPPITLFQPWILIQVLQPHLLQQKVSSVMQNLAKQFSSLLLLLKKNIV